MRVNLKRNGPSLQLFANGWTLKPYVCVVAKCVDAAPVEGQTNKTTRRGKPFETKPHWTARPFHLRPAINAAPKLPF